MKPSALLLIVLGALAALAVDAMQSLHRRFRQRLWSETLHLR